jgi:hypothetical protein
MVRTIQTHNSKYFWNLFYWFHHEPQHKHSATFQHLCMGTWLGITGWGKVPAVTLREVLPPADKCSNLFLCFASICKRTVHKGSGLLLLRRKMHITWHYLHISPTFSCRFAEVQKKALANVHSLSVSVSVTHEFETRFWIAVLRKPLYFK